jgi:hypothetical protein
VQPTSPPLARSVDAAFRGSDEAACIEAALKREFFPLKRYPKSSEIAIAAVQDRLDVVYTRLKRSIAVCDQAIRDEKIDPSAVDADLSPFALRTERARAVAAELLECAWMVTNATGLPTVADSASMLRRLSAGASLLGKPGAKLEELGPAPLSRRTQIYGGTRAFIAAATQVANPYSPTDEKSAGNAELLCANQSALAVEYSYLCRRRDVRESSHGLEAGPGTPYYLAYQDEQISLLRLTRAADYTKRVNNTTEPAMLLRAAREITLAAAIADGHSDMAFRLPTVPLHKRRGARASRPNPHWPRPPG